MYWGEGSVFNVVSNRLVRGRSCGPGSLVFVVLCESLRCHTIQGAFLFYNPWCTHYSVHFQHIHNLFSLFIFSLNLYSSVLSLETGKALHQTAVVRTFLSSAKLVNCQPKC